MRKFVVGFVVCLAIGAISSDAYSGEKSATSKKKKLVSFEYCCSKLKGNTDKCQKHRRVKGKKEKVAGKWVAKSCTQPEPAASEPTARSSQADGESA